MTPQDGQSQQPNEKKDEPSEYLTVEQLLDLPTFRHLKPSTLAVWRYQGRGPGFIKIGRKPFYRKDEITRWLREHEVNHEGVRPTQSKPAVPPPSAGRRDRTFGHKTKSNPNPFPRL